MNSTDAISFKFSARNENASSIVYNLYLANWIDFALNLRRGMSLIRLNSNMCILNEQRCFRAYQTDLIRL